MNYFICTSRHFTPHGRYELNKLTSLPMCGFIAQLVEHRTGIAEVTGSNPVEALIFFRLLLSSCLNWKIYCDDHSSLCSLDLSCKFRVLIKRDSIFAYISKLGWSNRWSIAFIIKSIASNRFACNSLVRSQDMLALQCQFQFFLAREFSLVTSVHSWRDSFYFSVKLHHKMI